jgi:hypothetical protein
MKSQSLIPPWTIRTVVVSNHNCAAAKALLFRREQGGYAETTANPKQGESVSTGARIFQLKIIVSKTDPPIWRRILIPENYSLGSMHLVVQSAIGFDNGHQHEFSYGNQSYGSDAPDAPEFLRYEEPVLLSEVFTDPDYVLRYRYDFTDNWEHAIHLEKVFQPNPDFSHPVCSDAAGAGPLEDMGGPQQYNQMIKAHSEPSGLSSVGGVGKLDEDTVKRPIAEIEPEQLNIQDVNERLRIWDTWNWSNDLDASDDEELSIENELDFNEDETVSLDDDDMELDDDLSIEDDDLQLDEDLELDDDDELHLDRQDELDESENSVDNLKLEIDTSMVQEETANEMLDSGDDAEPGTDAQKAAEDSPDDDPA